MGRPIKDIKNQRFGKLVALYIYGKSAYGTTIWSCQCDCGNKKNILVSNLTNGSTQSCGCFKTNKLIEKNKRENQYDISGSFGIGYTNNQETFYFDLDDYDKIKEYCWSLDSKGYLRAVKNKKRISMSRFILNFPDAIVDHINGNIADNRKENLRACNINNNMWNSKTPKTNKSGRKGVFFDKKAKTYYASIKCNNKQYNLGSFKSFEEAVEARIMGEKKYFGEFRRKEC